MTGQSTVKVAKATGGRSGIGRASALALDCEGARLFVATSVPEDGEAAVRQIVATGGEALFAHVDGMQADEVEALITWAVARYGHLECAHNSAGIREAWGTPLHAYPRDVWDRVLAVNQTGVRRCRQAESVQPWAQGHSAIVNTVSTAVVG